MGDLEITRVFGAPLLDNSINVPFNCSDIDKYIYRHAIFASSLSSALFCVWSGKFGQIDTDGESQNLTALIDK